jgi:hypothetical protein
MVTVTGTLLLVDAGQGNTSWYLTPTLRAIAPRSTSELEYTEIVMVSFSKKSPDPKTFAGQTITVRGEIPSWVAGMDLGTRLIRLISLDNVEVIGSGP